MDYTKDGSHDFKFTNNGRPRSRLPAAPAPAAALWARSRIPPIQPGESTTVHVTWKSKHHSGTFKQSVTINTNDPNRREVILTFGGEFTQQLQ